MSCNLIKTVVCEQNDLWTLLVLLRASVQLGYNSLASACAANNLTNFFVIE